MWLQRIVIILAFLPMYCLSNKLDGCLILSNEQLEITYSNKRELFEITLINGKLSKTGESELTIDLPSLWEDQFSGRELQILKSHSDFKEINIGKPFDTKSDGEVMVAAIYNPNDYTSNSFIISSKNKDVSQVKLDSKNTIFDLKISNSEKYIAAMYADYIIDDDGFFKSIAKNMGHPFNYWNFSIAIYDIEGEFICGFVIDDEVKEPKALLYWQE